MSIPYALSAHTKVTYYHPGGGRLKLPYRAIGFVALAASLLGALRARRHGMLFAVLPLGGLCWGVLMRHNTAAHGYEVIFYIGVPLALFALVLMRLLQGRRAGVATVGVAVAALVVFVLSSYQMGRTDARMAQPQRQAALMDDFRKIGSFTRGRSVYAPVLEFAPYMYAEGDRTIRTFLWEYQDAEIYNVRRMLSYFLAGSILQLERTVVSACGARCGRDYDFIISAERHDVPALLTPANRLAFLYDAAGATDLYQSQYDTAVSRAPLARSTFDVHLYGGDSLAWVKEPCTAEDVRSKFFLDVVPARRQSGFVRMDFDFPDYGVSWDDKCLAVVPLPDFAFGRSRIRTGQLIPGQGEIWKAEFSLSAK